MPFYGLLIYLFIILRFQVPAFLVVAYFVLINNSIPLDRILLTLTPDICSEPKALLWRDQRHEEKSNAPRVDNNPSSP